jgi:hypothetical protein
MCQPCTFLDKNVVGHPSSVCHHCRFRVSRPLQERHRTVDQSLMLKKSVYHDISTIHGHRLDTLHRLSRAAHRVQSHLVQGGLGDLRQFAFAFPLKSALDPLSDLGIVVGMCGLSRCRSEVLAALGGFLVFFRNDIWFEQGS